MRQAVLFWDLDGTLLVCRHGSVDAWRLAARAVLGREVEWARVDAAGSTDLSIAAQVCRLGGRDEATAGALMARYLEELPARLAADPARALANAGELLAASVAEAGLLNRLLTGNLRAAAFAKMASCGLAGHLNDGGFGEDGPERLAVADAARRRALAHCTEGTPMIVIGDTPKDVAAARAIGARVVAVATGRFDAEELLAWGPDVILEGLPPAAGLGALVERALEARPPPAGARCRPIRRL